MAFLVRPLGLVRLIVSAQHLHLFGDDFGGVAFLLVLASPLAGLGQARGQMQ